MTQEQAEQVLAAGFEAYEVALLSYRDAAPGTETPSELLRRTVREQCARLGVAERDLYLHYPQAASIGSEVVTGWRDGPIKIGTPMVTPASGHEYLRRLADDAVDRYERALADGLHPDTAHRQAAGDTAVANEAIELYKLRLAEKFEPYLARHQAATYAAGHTLAKLEREGGELPPASEWTQPAPVSRPNLNRDADPAEIASEAIGYATELIEVGVSPEDVDRALAAAPAAQAAVHKFNHLIRGGVDYPQARRQVLDGLRAPAEFGVEDITSAATEVAPSEDARGGDAGHDSGHTPAAPTFDDWETYPPEPALYQYDLAGSAVADYERRLAAGRDAAEARREVVNSYPEAPEIAEAALDRYTLFRGAGAAADQAREHAAADTVQQFTPHLTPEQLGHLRDAFAETGPETTTAASAEGPEIAERDPERGSRYERDEGDRLQDWIEAQDEDTSGGEIDPTNAGRNAPAPRPDIPERASEPGSWIARNLPTQPESALDNDYEPDFLDAEDDAIEQAAYDRGDEGIAPYVGLADAMTVRASRGADYREDADLTRTREAVNSLGDSEITEDDLARLGVTPEQFADLVEADDRRFDEYVEEQRAQLRSERDAAVAGMTAEQARSVVQEAEEIQRHLSGCNHSVDQCGTCSAEEHDSRADFWDLTVPAARERLADVPADTVTTAAAGPDVVAAQGVTAETSHTEVTDTAASDALNVEIGRGHHTSTGAVLGRVDAVLAVEDDAARLGAQVADCSHAVNAAESAVHRADLAEEDAERAERCARWNTDDDATERADDSNEEWGRG